MTQVYEEANFEKDEICLWQITEFFSRYSRPLLLGSVAAAVLVVAGWFFLAPWKAEIILTVEKMGNVEKMDNFVPSIDFLTWRKLTLSLPLLAQQRLKSGQIKDAILVADYQVLANPAWWEQSVASNFALTKSDIRNLVAFNKEFQESASSTILNISVTGAMRNPDDLERRLSLTADFIQQGATYLAIKSLLKSYLLELSQKGDFQRQIMQNEVELNYLQVRARKLELLRSKFPRGGNQLVPEIINGNSKFLPVESQLIAIYSDIDRLEEQNKRLRQALAQINLKNDFLKLAMPLLDQESNGLFILEQLIDLPILKQRSTPSLESDLTLQSIQQDLVAIQSRFSLGLTKNSVSKPIRSGLLLPLVGGFLGGGFLTLLWLLLRQSWRHHSLTHG